MENTTTIVIKLQHPQIFEIYFSVSLMFILLRGISRLSLCIRENTTAITIKLKANISIALVKDISKSVSHRHAKIEDLLLPILPSPTDGLASDNSYKSVNYYDTLLYHLMAIWSCPERYIVKYLS